MLNIHNSSDNRVVILPSDIDESAPLQIFQTIYTTPFLCKGCKWQSY